MASSNCGLAIEKCLTIQTHTVPFSIKGMQSFASIFLSYLLLLGQALGTEMVVAFKHGIHLSSRGCCPTGRGQFLVEPWDQTSGHTESNESHGHYLSTDTP